MKKKCNNCNNEVDINYKFCNFCGAILENNDNKEKYKNKKIGIIVIICLLLFILIYFSRFFIIGNYYLYKYAEPEFKNKYGDAIENIKYKKMDYCITSYNTCAGDSGSGRKKEKKCKIYNYDVYFKNGIQSKIYVFNRYGKIEMHDEIGYSEVINYMEKYKSSLNFSKIKPLYYSPYYMANNHWFNEKYVGLYYEKPIADVVDKDFLNKYTILVNDVQQYISNSNFELKSINVLIEFSDKKFIVHGYDFPKISVQDIKDYDNIESFLADYSIGDFDIDIDADDDEIKWSLNNEMSSLWYDRNKQNSKIKSEK